MENVTFSNDIDENSKSALNNALELCRTKKHEEAILALEKVAIEHSNNLIVHENIERVFTLLGRSDKAIFVFGQLSENAAASDPIQLTYAKLLALNGCFTQSLGILDNLLEISPQNTRALLLSAETLSQGGRVKEAEGKYQRVLDIEPNNPTANCALFIQARKNIPLSFLRKFLRPLAQKFPAFKRVALQILDAELLRRANSQSKRSPHTFSEWLELGQDRWRQHPEHHGKKTLLLEVPGSALKLKKRLQEETKAFDDILVSPENAEEILNRENEAWAMQVAALTDSIGYWDAVLTSTLYGHRKQYLQNLSLFAEMYGAHPDYPVSINELPFELLDAFTMEGQIPLQQGYINDRYPENYADVMDDADLDQYAACARENEIDLASLYSSNKILAYSGSGEVTNKIANKIPHLLDKNMSAAVFGSTDLYLESACLRVGGSQTTTIRFLPFTNHTTKVNAITLEEWDADPIRFDLVIAVNSVDTFGLGVSGESFDPLGDLKLMQRFRKMIKPDGHLAISVPIGKDRLIFNSARVYGAIRLPKLLEGWRIVESDGYDEFLLDSKGNQRPLLILKPNEVITRVGTE